MNNTIAEKKLPLWVKWGLGFAGIYILIALSSSFSESFVVFEAIAIVFSFAHYPTLLLPLGVIILFESSEFWMVYVINAFIYFTIGALGSFIQEHRIVKI